MPRVDYVSLITQSTTLDGFNATYLINATGTTGLNITLPPLVGNSDGIHYELIREDINPTVPVILQTSGTDILNQNLSGFAGSTGPLGLPPQTITKVKSLQGAWYIAHNTSLRRVTAKILFSTTFSGPTGPFLQAPGGPGGITTTGCYFSFPGIANEVISVVNCVMSAGTTAGVTGILILKDGTTGGSTTVYGTGTFGFGPGAPAVPPKGFGAINSFNNLPINAAVLELDLQVFGTVATAVNLYSLVMR